MKTASHYPRVNIYLDDPRLRETLKVAAARHRATVSGYCLDAIRHRLIDDGYLPPEGQSSSAREAAEALDRLRNRIGPIGIPVSELIAEGRR